MIKILLKFFKIKKRKICKNCWFYHKRDGKCRLSIGGSNSSGMWVNKYETCKHFMR